MTDDSSQYSRLEQHNHGSGIQFGGDNYGSIQMVDTKTRAVLEKLTEQAPALGRLVERALRDGVMSVDVAAQLARAARNINEDVAGALLTASYRINGDVAGSLADSSLHINHDTAGQLAMAASQLESASRTLSTSDMRHVVSQVADAADRLAEVVTALGEHTNQVATSLGPRIILSLKTLALMLAFAFVVAFVAGCIVYAHMSHR